MFLVTTKPQNRIRILVLFLLAGCWYLLTESRFELLVFLVNGLLGLIIFVVLGNATRFVFDKAGWNPRKIETANILDAEEDIVDRTQEEDIKDKATLNYGIIWAIIFIFISLAV